MVDWIKTGLGVTQTMKNMARFKEITAVLARNGFDEFIIKTGLHEHIPNFVLPQSRINKALSEYDDDSWAESIGYRLRKSFEELGPSFVKLGQLLGTREDIFPEPFITEMNELRDRASTIPFEEAVATLDRALGCPHGDVFKSLDPEPIGRASIGVAYGAVLKTGEAVVVKIRRPGIRKTIKSDFAVLELIIRQLERVSRDIAKLGLSKIVRDFGAHLETELDYRVEARNCDRLRENIARIDDGKLFYLPKVYLEYSNDEVLVLEKIQGVPFTDTDAVNGVKDVIQEKLEEGIHIFVHTLLIDGFFHADLHGGNFFLMQDHRIGLIDFGLVGTLGKKNRANLVAILYALLSHNYENLVYEFLDVAEYDTIPDVDDLIRDVKDCLSPYIGMTVQQINVSVVFRTIMKTLSRHNLYLPREWFIVFRAMIALDGVGKSLDMDFDVFGIISKDIHTIIQEFFSKEQIIEEGMWIGRDMLNAARGLPRHLRWFLKEFSKRSYALETYHKGYERELQKLNQTFNFLGFALLSAVFVFSGVHMMTDTAIATLADVPKTSWVMWTLALFFFAYGRRLARKDRRKKPKN